MKYKKDEVMIWYLNSILIYLYIMLLDHNKPSYISNTDWKMAKKVIYFLFIYYLAL